MNAVTPVILIGWVVFWLGWVAAAFATKRGQTNWGRYAGFRILSVVVVILLIRGNAFRGNAAVHNPWLEGVGLALFVLGVALAVWARVYIGANWGTPMSQKEDPELVTTGPYARVRHPIYSGIILAMIGTAVAVSTYWIAPVLVLGVYFTFSANREECYMLERFPDTYPEYKRSTKILIPYIF